MSNDSGAIEWTIVPSLSFASFAFKRCTGSISVIDTRTSSIVGMALWNAKGPVSKENSGVKKYTSPYFEIRKTVAQLPNIELERTICFSRSKLGCMRASILFCNRAAHWDALNWGASCWELHCGFKVDKINTGAGYGKLHRAQWLWMPLDNKIITECILQKSQGIIE